ncbi:MAG TPA: DUF2752 domain-containing protein [Thermoanaerobaculia bacterium]|nr:DUF2752 domain-containing protein [Thermoanaerobaculia bacterium]
MTTAGSERPPVAGWAVAGMLGAAGLLLLHVWAPSDDIRYSICLWRRLLGIPCPGCGMTRALAHLAKGEWRAALAVHPLSPLIAGELVLGWIAWGAAAFGIPRSPGRLPRPSRLPRWLGPQGLAALLLANVALLTALWMGRLAAGALPR